MSTNQLTDAERWLFLLAPVSSAFVWGGSVMVGNAGWADGLRSPYPIQVTVVMTMMTFLVYLLTLPVLVRLYKHWRNGKRNVGGRLFLSGLLVGSAWGLLLKPIGPAYIALGPLCGAAVGLFLAVGTGETTNL
ncbi:hypothetical protein ACT2FY_00380 [Paraburkholderia fungorum]|uniref:hypothetical protein n=1 Tax=Paraburkholderia fungorum TaxID=134537 RepID=UPI00402B5980